MLTAVRQLTLADSMPVNIGICLTCEMWFLTTRMYHTKAGLFLVIFSFTGLECGLNWLLEHMASDTWPTAAGRVSHVGQVVGFVAL